MATKLRFGTAGIPISSEKRDGVSGILRVRELNLSAMELEFVRGVGMKKETAKKLGDVAKKNDVLLTSHAPYFINLASNDEKKVEASIKRLLDTARICYLAGGYSVVFHAGFFQDMPPKRAYGRVRLGIKNVVDVLNDEGIGVWVRPETTGKPSQFSGLEDLIAISQEFENVLPCIDFAHLHARSAGRYNSEKEFCAVMDMMEGGLGKESLRNMHIHMSGIEYTEKGERRHIPLEESDMKWKELMKCLKKRKVAGVVISESPLIEEDALRMKNYYLNTQI